MTCSPDNIFLDIQTSMAGAYRSRPPIFSVIAALGIKVSTLAHCLGVSRSTVSLWKTGRDPLPFARHDQLVKICQQASVVAMQLVGQTLADSECAPVMRTAAEVYAQRLGQAKDLLAKIE